MSGAAEPLELEEGFVDISEAQDRGLLKKILVEGKGDETPPPGSHVEVHYVGTLHADGSKFDSSRDRPGNFKFDVGVGQVIKGWDTGICSMKRGEKCILRCRHDYAYGESGSPPTIPENATLNFEVELFGWKEKTKTAGEMTAEERSAYASAMKEQGTECFKVQDWAGAINRYEDGIEYITYAGGGGGGDEDEEEVAELDEEGKKLAVALLNNSAMAKLKMGDNDSAKFDCTKALQYEPSNVKAIFRRAQAELALGNFATCGEDAQRVLELEPGNKEAQLLKRKAVEMEKQLKRSEKAMCAKMFG